LSPFNNNLRKIAHNYYVETTQTYKLVKEIFEKLVEDMKKISETMGDQEFMKNNELNMRMLNEIIKVPNKLMEMGIEEFKKKYGEKYKHILNLEECTDRKICFTKEYNDYAAFYIQTGSKQKYQQLVLKMSLIYLIALMEAFNKDFFLELLSQEPKIMISNKEIKYSEILSHNSIEDLHKVMAKKIINDISHLNIDELAEVFMEKRFNIDLEKEYKRWETLREKYYRRNILVHKGGKVDKIYIEKMKVDEFLLDKELDIDLKYIKNAFKDVHRYISFIEDTICKKFNVT